MPNAGQRLQDALDGYATFVRDKELALPKHQSHLVHWVREFLAFATHHPGHMLDQTLDLYLAEVGKRAPSRKGRPTSAIDARPWRLDLW